MAPVPDAVDLNDLCAAAVDAASDGESVEAFAEEGRRTEASAFHGEVEGLEFAESRGVGVRVILDGRLGYAYAADPSEEEVREAVRLARANAALAEPDEGNALPPTAAGIDRMPELFDERTAAASTDHKITLALDLEARTIGSDPRVTKVDTARFGDEVSRVAIASTNGVRAEYSRTDAWCVTVALAVDGD